MKSDEEVMAELKRAVAGLWFMSESDYPFEVFRWDGTVELEPRFLREASGEGPNAAVRVLDAEEFFGGSMPEMIWKKDETETPATGNHLALRQTLEENLEELRVFKIGEINMPVLIVGRSREGNWLGVSTRVVET